MTPNSHRVTVRHGKRIGSARKLKAQSPSGLEKIRKRALEVLLKVLWQVQLAVLVHRRQQQGAMTCSLELCCIQKQTMIQRYGSTVFVDLPSHVSCVWSLIGTGEESRQEEDRVSNCPMVWRFSSRGSG